MVASWLERGLSSRGQWIDDLEKGESLKVAVARVDSPNPMLTHCDCGVIAVCALSGLFTPRLFDRVPVLRAARDERRRRTTAVNVAVLWPRAVLRTSPGRRGQLLLIPIHAHDLRRRAVYGRRLRPRQQPPAICVTASIRPGYARIPLAMSTAAGQAAPRTPTGTPEAHAGRSVPADARGQVIDLSPLGTLLARIHERLHPEQIWLFGSRARGDAKPGSDWDLLVVLSDDAPDRDLDPLLAWQLQKGSGVYADVIPLRASEFREDLGAVNTILYDVAREGVRIDVR
jgi:uncharacterized protein